MICKNLNDVIRVVQIRCRNGNLKQLKIWSCEKYEEIHMDDAILKKRDKTEIHRCNCSCPHYKNS